ncbi:hypothetical protein VNO77_24377 [Canavalia gladiata]|uniref:Uncharacterized protein n=1 Tax=Canavalia gladiata TaxID=3824 RepID=A0AAN9L664_CANGL
MRSGSRIRPEEDVRGCGHVAHCRNGRRTRVPAATMKQPPPPPGFREAESDSPPVLRLESVLRWGMEGFRCVGIKESACGKWNRSKRSSWSSRNGENERIQVGGGIGNDRTHRLRLIKMTWPVLIRDNNFCLLES